MQGVLLILFSQLVRHFRGQSTNAEEKANQDSIMTVTSTDWRPVWMIVCRSYIPPTEKKQCVWFGLFPIFRRRHRFSDLLVRDVKLQAFWELIKVCSMGMFKPGAFSDVFINFEFIDNHDGIRSSFAYLVVKAFLLDMILVSYKSVSWEGSIVSRCGK